MKSMLAKIFFNGTNESWVVFQLDANVTITMKTFTQNPRSIFINSLDNVGTLMVPMTVSDEDMFYPHHFIAKFVEC